MTGKEGFDLVVVANRLPVDFTVGPGGEIEWKRSPGGLVTALEPVMQASDGAWVGWSGAPDLASEPFDADEFMRQHPQWSWQKGYLYDRPSQPWTLFD